MSKAKKDSQTYQSMLSEVESIVSEVSSPNLDLDIMVGKIEKGYELIKALRERLDQTKQKVEDLRQQYEDKDEEQDDEQE